MIKIVFIILIYPIVLFSNGFYVQNDIVDKKSVYYFKNINKKFTGILINTVKNVTSKTEYVDGLKSGTEVFYTPDKILWETMFFQNKKHGLEKFYYLNGKLKKECMYVKNILDGICKEYFDNSKLYQQSLLIDGKLNGLARKYFNTGELWGEIYFLDDKANGEAKTYYKNGKLKSVITFSKGTFISGYLFDTNGTKKILSKEQYLGISH